MKPNLIVVMGVSGCGKSSVAEAISKEYDYEFVEADDYHPEENKQHMASGKPLTDAMREPWIALLRGHLKQAARVGRSCVMSFSGLRRMHRSQIRDLPFNVLFLHLEGDQPLIRDRMNAREDHFMPPSLLDSQYATLENPLGEPKTIGIDIDQTLKSVIETALKVTSDALKI